jgi:alpha-glucosidase
MPGASDPIGRLVRKASLVVRTVADVGPSTLAAMATSSVRSAVGRRRDRRADAGPATSRGPGDLLSADAVVDAGETVGARCRFAEAELELRFLADDLVRLTWGPGEPPLPWALVDPDVGSGPATAGSVAVDGAGGCVVATPALRVVVGGDGSVRFFAPGGALLRHELPPLRRAATRTARFVLRPSERLSGLGEQASTVDLRGTVHRLWNRDPGGAWGPGEDPLYCGIPVIVGLHPAGDVLAFYENPYEAVVRIDAADEGVGSSPRAELTFAGGTLRHYVTAGPLPRLVTRYAELTGRPPLPPRWALGYHQSKWGYRDDGDIREVSAGFRTERLPLSAVHLDIDYMDGYRVFSVDRERFPDLAGLAAELADRGTRVVTIVDPAVKVDPADDVFAAGVRDGRFLLGDDGEPLTGVVWPGKAVFPDFTDASTRRWWAGWYRRLVDAGVAGVWHDMNEPTSLALWGDRTLPRDVHHAAEGRGGDHRECHNVYGLLMDRAGWEALADLRPDRRPFVLSRAGWAGLQRWAWTWTGDVRSTWDGLRQQVATAIGLGLSGVTYTGSDTGGFSGVPSPELYVRWLELSVLMPFCRTHSAIRSPNREPWRFTEPYRAAIGRLIRFRYRVLPYLYTLADEASRLGHPMVRPLCWPAAAVDPDAMAGPVAGPDGPAAGSSADRRLWSVDDAYLLGDALLVAPIAAAGARSRPVPLPAGRWYRWCPLPAMADDDRPGPAGAQPAVDAPVADAPAPVDVSVVVEGGRTVRVDAPTGQPTVFVRGGSIVPLDDGWLPDGPSGAQPGDGQPGVWPAHRSGDRPDDGALAAGHEPRRLAVHCFPDADGAAAGTVYDDAGDGFGPWRRDRFRLVIVGGDRGDAPAETVLTWERDGNYPAPDGLRVVVHGVAASRASADGRDVDVRVERPAGGLPVSVVDGVAAFAVLRFVR